MLNKKRASLGLGDVDGVDIEDLISVGHRASPTQEQHKKIMDAGEINGFVSRNPNNSRRKRSPYTHQFGGKCRLGMKSIFQEAAYRLNVNDTQALESAILALIEKEGFDDLKKEFNRLVGVAPST